MSSNHPWTSSEWTQRRADFIKEGQSAPNVLEFRVTHNSFDQEVEQTRRSQYVDHLLSCGGLGKNDAPKGRQAAYTDACAPFDYKDKAELDRNKLQFIGHCPGASSCGLLIRAAWQLLGAGDMSLFASSPPDPKRLDPRLRQSYDAFDVFQQIAQWGYNCGALHGGYKNVEDKPIQGPAITIDDPDHWKAGDVIFVKAVEGDGQHIFTFVEKKKHDPKAYEKTSTWSISSVDGGMGITGDDENCMAVQTANRSCSIVQRRLTFTLSSKAHYVAWWIDFGKVRFSDPEYFFARRGKDHPWFGRPLSSP